MKKILMSIFLVVILIAGGVTLGIIQSNKAKTPTSTVQIDLNPSASFIVNSNNIVLSVAYNNADADLIYCDIECVGRRIEDVAKEFTQKAIQASSSAKEYIKLDVTSSADENTNCINITVSGNAEQCEALKNSLVEKVNGVFDENGIFGRAVANIKTQTTNLVEKYTDIAQDLKLDAEDFANKTEAEVLTMINEQGKKFEGLTSQSVADLQTFINSSVITSIKNSINQLESQIESLQETFGVILTDSIKTQIAQLQSQVKSKLAEIEQKVNEKIAELRQTAKTQFETLKTTLNQKIEAHKVALEAHKAQFEANKDTILADIKAWRESFNTSSEA